MLNVSSLLADKRLARTFVVALVGLALAACSDARRLVIHSQTGEHVFEVDVVDNDKTRAQGLMYVQELAENAGMLFDFQQTRPVSFWMMNTFIPLDMLFIEADGTILNIHANARPHDRTSIPSAGPVRFVLEIPGGRSEELGIEAGDTVEHERIVAEQ